MFDSLKKAIFLVTSNFEFQKKVNDKRGNWGNYERWSLINKEDSDSHLCAKSSNIKSFFSNYYVNVELQKHVYFDERKKLPANMTSIF